MKPLHQISRAGWAVLNAVTWTVFVSAVAGLLTWAATAASMSLGG